MGYNRKGVASVLLAVCWPFLQIIDRRELKIETAYSCLIYRIA